MITGEITLYDEPLPVYQSNYQSVVVKKETPEERTKWLELCAEELDKAKQLFTIGDKIKTKTNNQSHMTITAFINDVEKMQKYQGMPCVVYGKNTSFINASDIQYSIGELAMETHLKVNIPNV